MLKHIRYIMLVAIALLALTSAARAAEALKKIPGNQIRSYIAGMEMTDDVHYRDTFERNGVLVSYRMGRKIIGKWRVEKRQLGVERSKDQGDCYEVWISGNKIELRREGLSLPIEGVLEKSSTRRL